MRLERDLGERMINMKSKEERSQTDTGKQHGSRQAHTEGTWFL